MRPDDLEDCTVIDFYINYEIVSIRAKRQNHDTYFFTNEDHPGKKYLIVRPRLIDVIPKLPFWSFGDAKNFHCDIMNDIDAPITQAMEDYAENVLLLFTSYRQKEDLQEDGSFVKNLRTWLPTTETHQRRKITTFLQNIQDVFNSLNMEREEDDLSRTTEPFYEAEQENDPTDTIYQPDNIAFDSWLLEMLMNDERQVNDGSQQALPESLQYLINKGKNNCGTRNIANIVDRSTESFYNNSISNDNNLINIENISNNLITNLNFITHISNTEQSHVAIQESILTEPTVSKQCLVNLLLSQCTRRLTSTTANEPVFKVIASGTCESIVKWGLKTLDHVQQRAFQILTGTFILTFFDDATDSIEESSLLRH
jgi:hypothetical protein